MDRPTVPLTPRHDLQVQLPQLLFAHRRRRIDHQVDRLRRLRKRNHLTEARCTSQYHHNPVQPQRDPAMWRRPVLQRIQKESEPRPRFFLRLSLHALGARIVRVDEQRDYLDLEVSLAGTIIGIIPVLLMIPVIDEFHALNDMVTEPDTDIGVRLYVVRH